MAVQDTYSEGLRPAVEGQIADMTAKVLISRSVQNVEGIVFGKAVGQHPDIDGGCVPYAAGGKFLGVAVRERSITAGGIEGFNQYESVRIMTKGTIWMKVVGAVKAGDPVFIGANGASNAAAAGLVEVDGQFDTSATAAGALALVRLK